MSNLFLINIIDTLEYESYKLLSNKLVKCALEYDLGVHFNHLEPDLELISAQKMKQFFIISNDFIQTNSENIDTWRIKFKDLNEFELKLKNSFCYLDKFIEVLFDYVSHIVIYITNDNVLYDSDFEEINVTKDNVVECIVKRTLREPGLSIPSLKLCLYR